MNYAKLKQLLQNPKRIVITTHKSPDADAIGSSQGLALILEKLGHKVSVICPDFFPEFLNWLNPLNNLIVFEQTPEIGQNLLLDAEVIFSLDYNEYARVGEQMEKILPTTSALKILIDHHQQPGSFPDFILSDTSASSTAQLVFDFVETMGWFHLIDKNAADALYAGIMTDTGGFRFNSTSAHTHLVVSKLIDKGVKVDEVYNLINDQNSVSRMLLLGHLLNNRMKVFENFNSVYFYLTNADLKKFNYAKGDTEGFVNYGLSIKNIIFSTIIIEHDDAIRMSFRSKGSYNVNSFARLHFNGGGHINAAGGRSFLTLEQTITQLEKLIPQFTKNFSK